MVVQKRPKKAIPRTQRTQAQIQGRIRPGLREVIRLMVEEGFTIEQAAKKLKYQTHSLKCAFKKPHVAAYKTEVLRAFIEGEKDRAFQKMVYLRDHALSEHVQAEMAKTISKFDERFQPKSKITHAGNINLKSVGYIIDLSDIDATHAPDQPDHVLHRDVIDVELDQ